MRNDVLLGWQVNVFGRVLFLSLISVYLGTVCCQLVYSKIVPVLIYGIPMENVLNDVKIFFFYNLLLTTFYLHYFILLVEAFISLLIPIFTLQLSK